jgi:hypothetical protein
MVLLELRAAFRATVDRELVAIEGKTMRGSFDTSAGQNRSHVVSTSAGEARLILGHISVGSKSKGITAFRCCWSRSI